eukprot:COSAG01_NODE_4606_length_4884_cov_3.073981_8_plen_295_part_00
MNSMTTLTMTGHSLLPPRDPCALRRCQGRRGCICIRAGPLSTSPRPLTLTAPHRAQARGARTAGSSSSGGAGVVVAAAPQSNHTSRPPQRRPRAQPASCVEAFASSIGINLKEEPALRWVAQLGFADAPTAAAKGWLKRGGSAQATGNKEGAPTGCQCEPREGFYQQLAAYVRSVQQPEPINDDQQQPEVDPEAELRPEPEPEPEPETHRIGPWQADTLSRTFSELEQSGGGHRSSSSLVRPEPAATVNTSMALSSRAVLRMACAEFGWRDERHDNCRGDILWAGERNVRPAPS